MVVEIAKRGNWTLHRIDGRLTVRGAGAADMDAAMYKYIEFGKTAFENVVVDSSMERFSEAGNEGVFFIATSKLKKPVSVLLAYSGDRGEGVCRLDDITGRMARSPKLWGWIGIAAGLMLAIFLVGLIVLPIGVWFLMLAAKIQKGAFEIDRAFREHVAAINAQAAPAAPQMQPAPASA